jgi:hypothetical protein
MKIMNGVVLDGGMYYWDGSNDGMMAKVMMGDMMMPNTMIMILLLAMYE